MGGGVEGKRVGSCACVDIDVPSFGANTRNVQNSHGVGTRGVKETISKGEWTYLAAEEK